MNFLRTLAVTAALLPAAITAQVAPAAPSFFDSDGVRIRYVERGQGRPVVLLHGFAGNVELVWGATGIIDALVSSYRVIALDMRGHGLSDKPHGIENYGIRFVSDVVNLLDHLGLERAHVVGYSLGAVIAARLVTAHPERVQSVVLGGGGMPERGELPPWRHAWLAGMERAARGETSIMDVLRMPDWPPLEPAMEDAINRNDAAALLAILQSDAGLQVPDEELRRNTVPVLALIGTDDVMARGSVEQLADLMTNLDVIWIPGANHLTTLVHPTFVEQIRRFLDSQS